MKLRIFYLLAALAMLVPGLTGCGAAGEPDPREESVFELVTEEDTSSAEEYFAETSAESVEDISEEDSEYVEYWFRTKKLRDEHYEKHGKEMGFSDADDYRRAASDVVNDPRALHKIEQEDGDDVYYIEETNEFVVVSTDGYLRTYFNPDRGKAYFDKQ